MRIEQSELNRVLTTFPADVMDVYSAFVGDVIQGNTYGYFSPHKCGCIIGLIDQAHGNKHNFTSFRLQIGDSVCTRNLEAFIWTIGPDEKHPRRLTIIRWIEEWIMQHEDLLESCIVMEEEIE